MMYAVALGALLRLNDARRPRPVAEETIIPEMTVRWAEEGAPSEQQWAEVNRRANELLSQA
jgi:hypothetical protein